MLVIVVPLLIDDDFSGHNGTQGFACAYEALVVPCVAGGESVVVEQNGKISLI
jgi:hypothetical protein